MVWDEDWANQDPVPTGVGSGHGEAWERLNNYVFLEWQRFNARLAAYAERRESDRKPLTQAERSEHVSRFRAMLFERYQTTGVDPRWEAERAKRLSQRERNGRPEAA